MKNTLTTNLLLLLLFASMLACHQDKETDQSPSSSEKETDEALIADEVLEDTVVLTISPDTLQLTNLPKKILLTLTNYTEDTIMTGLHYRIEQLKDKNWVGIPADYIFNDLGYELYPTAIHTFDVHLLSDDISYQAGTYRITKSYHTADYQATKQTYPMSAIFVIQ